MLRWREEITGPRAGIPDGDGTEEGEEFERYTRA